MKKVHSRTRRCKKQEDQGLTDGSKLGLSKKSITCAYMEANNTHNKGDSLSLVKHHSQMKVADRDEMENKQQETQSSIQNYSQEIYDQIKEATTQWTIAQNLQVTCGRGDVLVVNKLVTIWRKGIGRWLPSWETMGLDYEHHHLQCKRVGEGGKVACNP